MTTFDEADGGTPNWEIGRPQPAFVALEEAGEIAGVVLDVGCGTGENALFLAGRGHAVRGVDSAPRAIAREQAQERGLPVTFLQQDALRLDELGRTFDTVLDSGLFHALADPERPRHVLSLAAALRPGGTCHMLAFSELEPGTHGPAGSPGRRSGRRSATGGASTGFGPRPSRGGSNLEGTGPGSRRSPGFEPIDCAGRSGGTSSESAPGPH